MSAPRWIAIAGVILLAGCGHKEAKVKVPAPPAISEPQAQPQEAEAASAPNQSEPAKSPVESEEALHLPADAKPVLVETGLASWYGPPYHNRRSSNGEVYNMHALTAAHRTLPLESIVRVTNEKTGHSTLVRITDRGPFVEGRILDLSLAAAKKVDVWRPGVAPVRLEVLYSPAPLNAGGRWAVQIGGFEKQHSADKLAGQLSRRYHTAKALSFGSPAGNWWVRVRVQDDDKKRAEEVARDTRTNEGSIFVIRLD